MVYAFIGGYVLLEIDMLLDWLCLELGDQGNGR